ncbi:MAG: mechanosensitive ion channel family protein, partial [Polyangiaceae bacterium]|nr:mechanosensitive ion channel family protein [Polyangiaceae bacterium]
GDQTHVLALQQVKLPNGTTAWMFPRSTVAAVRPIYEANQRRWLEEHVPEWLKRRQGPGLLVWQWLGLMLLGLAAYGVGRGLGRLLVRTLINVVGRYFESAMSLVRALSRPARLALGVLVFELGLPYLILPASVERGIGKASNIVYIFAAALAVVGIVRVATSTWEQKLPEDTIGIVENRGLRTRLAMLRRIATVLVGFVAAGLALLQFEVVRSVGLSILASAGIVGVLVGFAAQRTLGGVIAGIEMSITEPVRIGDMVEFEQGEVGTVEQIYFTYIVVRLWDDRRQIVPVTRVMAAPFENWTRTGVDLLVPVEILADHATPLETLRKGFRDVCEKCEKWDRRSWRVDVIEITDKAIRVRGTASVASATDAYDLRAELRERWFTFLQQLEGGKYLPHGRVVSPSVEEAPPPSRPQLESSTTPDSSSSKPSPKKG